MDGISKNEFNQAMTKVDRRFDVVEKRFAAVVQRFDVLESRLATTTVRLETKIDDLEHKLETKIEEEVGGLATMITKGFADIEKRRDVKDRVDVLEKKVAKVETAINIQLHSSPSGSLSQ